MSIISQLSLENKICSMYPSESEAFLSNMISLMNYGSLAQTGKMIILPVDQGFEHGPDRSFLKNPEGFDPSYHYQLAKEAGFSALACHIGILEALQSDIQQDTNPVPTILKLNTNNAFDSSKQDTSPYQSIIASVEDAVRLGCVGVGFTIYPGSKAFQKMLTELSEVVRNAKKYGLVVVTWAYPRGENIVNKLHITSKQAETAIDVSCYAAHMACLVGTHIVKMKMPTKYIYSPEDIFPRSKETKEKLDFCNRYFKTRGKTHTYTEKTLANELDIAISEKPFAKQETELLHDMIESKEAIELLYKSCYPDIEPIEAVKRACFNGKRLVIFSGGESKDINTITKEVTEIACNNGDGSIIGRNAFQREKSDAVAMIRTIADIYKKCSK